MVLRIAVFILNLFESNEIFKFYLSCYINNIKKDVIKRNHLESKNI